ncbi:MAG: thioredoxin domain-containing protein [Actinomycetota bacterium]
MNRLAKATSPYLLQHAHNPVDWYEWSPEALERANREDKPLLLSIGYAACHWCHVMERESFEDQSTADLMNEHFVCIKIDREERPDLDSIYMTAVQALTGRGGWPMTMFCTPSGEPFFGGTYFPPADNHGLPGFKRVLQSVSDAWRAERAGVLEQSEKLRTRVTALMQVPGDQSSLTRETLDEAFSNVASQFDPVWGGFGGAPKFPQSMTLEFLIRMLRTAKRAEAERILTTTLDRMASGGIFDHIGGGFARYSVDNRWHVPHFEKMLYDNALLLKLYARASVLFPGRGYADTATMTGEFLLRELRQPSGGFSSSLDADSEGAEGKFYVWTRSELQEICGADAPAALEHFDVSEDGNWEGTNVLWNPGNKTMEPAQLQRIRSLLLEARGHRTRPATDDKILASWNALAISGLAEAGRLLGRNDFIEAGLTASGFVLESLTDEKGRLQRSYRDGRCSGPAFLDDYAMLANALLDLYETIFDEDHFVQARSIADAMIELFTDPAGGFFDTGTDQPELYARPKDLYDNAIPSGSSSAIGLLLRLAAFTGDERFQRIAEPCLATMQQAMAHAPLGFGSWLVAVDDATSPMLEIAISTTNRDETADSMLERVWSNPTLARVLACGDSSRTAVPLLEHRSQSTTTAFVCERFVCKQPVTDAEALESLLAQETSSNKPRS